MGLKFNDLIQELFYNECDNLPDFVTRVQTLLHSNIMTTTDLIDNNLLEEIKSTYSADFEPMPVYFGNTLRDLKCIITDDCYREHEVFVTCNGPKKFSIKKVTLPHSSILGGYFSSLQDLAQKLKQFINDLSGYFVQLESIDKQCTVMEPVQPTLADDYRKIFIDERTWLNVEITLKGLATNIHLIGNCQKWYNKLQIGIMNWDHDKNVVENILHMFDLDEIPHPSGAVDNFTNQTVPQEEKYCFICLCSKLPDKPCAPQPLCQNPKCDVNFHRSCLFDWLVTSAGGCPPTFGVATGNCPTCLQPILCNERES